MTVVVGNRSPTVTNPSLQRPAGLVQLTATEYASDPDGDPLTYTWTWQGQTQTGPVFAATLPAGTAVVTLAASDGSDTGVGVLTVAVTQPSPPLPQDMSMEPYPDGVVNIGGPESNGFIYYTNAAHPSPLHTLVFDGGAEFAEVERLAWPWTWTWEKQGERGWMPQGTSTGSKCPVTLGQGDYRFTLTVGVPTNALTFRVYVRGSSDQTPPGPAPAGPPAAE